MCEEAIVLVHKDLLCDDLLTEANFMDAVDKFRQAHVIMDATIGRVAATLRKFHEAQSSKEPTSGKGDSEKK
jgi:hypothetical protein